MTLSGVFNAVVARCYDADIQLAPAQIEAIAGAIATRGPNCALLVFGLGHDSALWAELNSGGRTLFVEDDAAWASRGESAGLEVERVAYPTTVAGSLASPDEAAASAEMPKLLAAQRWDVVLIDGPRGWKPHLPGRSLPIAWSARVQDAATHIFLHDYERPLEQKLAAEFLLPRGRWTIIPGDRDDVRKLFWSIGRSSGFDMK